MAELHSSLTNLGPVDFTDVPLDNLETYLRSHFEAGELICNSVPPPPGGDHFHSATPQHSEPDTAASSKDIAASTARSYPPHQQHADLQGSWGKPYKMSAKENPLDVKVYKMAGHDRHGAWFARRSVHEGISFTKFRKAMRWEFLHSMATEGGPGAGAVRGIGVDSRVESHKVDKTGQIEVYQLSAQFPGPTTPREFNTLLLTSQNALSQKSASDGEHIPRHLMIVSKPVTHPEIPDRSGYIRGSYESVEMIREIPLHKKSGKSASTSDLLEKHTQSSKSGRERGSTISFAESRGPDAKGENVDTQENADDGGDPELNPIEWIMVTRSDPGGGIPRFMVERGTPSSICADVAKFFDWACSKDDIPDTDQDEVVEEVLERRRSEVPPVDSALTEETSAQAQSEPSGGILQTVTAGINAYAPAAVADAAQSLMANGQQQGAEDDDSSSETSSYESADDFFEPTGLSVESLTLSQASSPSDPSSPASTRVTGIAQHDREIQKIEQQKKKLEQKLAKKKETESNKISSQQGKNEIEQAKAKERLEREIKKTEDRHAKEVEKLEARKNREVEKAKKKRQKQLDRDMISKITRERDDFRSRIDLIQRENELLRDQIGEVQRENTALVRRLSKLAGGEVAMQAIRDEMATNKKGRPNSTRSISSVA